SLSSVDYEFDTFDPSIGFANQAAFEQYINRFLTFDATTDTLSVTDPSSTIAIYTLNMAADSPPVTVSFDIDALAGSVPEPATWIMLALGMFGASALARLHSRPGRDRHWVDQSGQNPITWSPERRLTREALRKG